MNVAGFMTKWAQDVADAQGAGGEVPAVVPNMLRALPDGGPAWADAAVICPWTMYLCYGDARILERNYATMARFMDFLAAVSPGFIRCDIDYPGWPGFGDWLSINANTPRDLIGTAFLAHDADLMARIATVLGKSRDAAKYRRLFIDVRKAFGERYLKGGKPPSETPQPSQVRQMLDGADAISRGNLKVVDYGLVSSDVFNTDVFTPAQTAYVLALHFDLLPEKLRPLAVQELVADIERRGMHLSTGFVGASYLPFVLSQNGRLDVAYALLNQKTWPSWLYAVTKGATTIWERWDGWTEENGFQDPGMNSFNHYAYGSIGAWMYAVVAGIDVDPDQPGYKHAVLRPHPGGGLTQASGRLNTVFGELVSEWRMAEGAFEWRMVVPANATATAHVPEGVGANITLDGQVVAGLLHELGPGEHRLVAS
jgi:alpha-L-rhamnosidase